MSLVSPTGSRVQKFSIPKTNQEGIVFKETASTNKAVVKIKHPQKTWNMAQQKPQPYDPFEL
jgi:hypothetical protein